MERKVITVGNLGVNCVILSENGRALVTDPGQEADRIVEYLSSRSLVPTAVLLTHAHFDHIGAVPELQRRYPDLPVYLGERDHPLITHPFNAYPPIYPAIALPANLRPASALPTLVPGVSVLDTPGHSPGGVSYHFAAERLLLSGDTLFAGCCGRTDFPGGDAAALQRSLRRLMTLPGDTEVIPGHGAFTTIAAELRCQMF